MSTLSESIPVRPAIPPEQVVSWPFNPLEQASRRYGSKETSRRSHERRQFRIALSLVTLNPSGQKSSFVVFACDISNSGLAFLHRTKIAVGTPCLLKGILRSWKCFRMRGEIVRFKELGEGIYEIGLQFGQPIDYEQLALDKEARTQERIASSIRHQSLEVLG